MYSDSVKPMRCEEFFYSRGG